MADAQLDRIEALLVTDKIAAVRAMTCFVLGDLSSGFDDAQNKQFVGLLVKLAPIVLATPCPPEIEKAIEAGRADYLTVKV